MPPQPKILKDGTSFELTPLRNYLKKRSRDKHYQKALADLNAIQHTWSAFYDLTHATELLQFLDQDVDGTKRFLVERASVVSASFNQAILMYVRSTKKDGDRKGLQIESHLTEDELKFHRQLQGARNKVIAHLDKKTRFFGKNLHDEKPVLVHRNGSGHEIRLAHMRVTSDARIISQFLELILKVLNIAQTLLLEKSSQVAASVSELSKVDPQIGIEIERTPFDAVTFFGSEESARRFIFGVAFVPDPDFRGVNYPDRPD